MTCLFNPKYLEGLMTEELDVGSDRRYCGLYGITSAASIAVLASYVLVVHFLFPMCWYSLCGKQILIQNFHLESCR